MILIDATVTVSGDVTERLSARSDFGEEEGGLDGQLVWWGDQDPGPSDEPLVMHFHQDGSAHLLDPAEDAERLILGRVTPDRDRVRVQVNSHRRLRKLLRILADIGAEPEVAEQAQSEPSLDFGPVPDGGSPASANGREPGWNSPWPCWTSVPRGTPPRAPPRATRPQALQLERPAAPARIPGRARRRARRTADRHLEWLRTEPGRAVTVRQFRRNGRRPRRAIGSVPRPWTGDRGMRNHRMYGRAIAGIRRAGGAGHRGRLGDRPGHGAAAGRPRRPRGRAGPGHGGR